MNTVKSFKMCALGFALSAGAAHGFANAITLCRTYPPSALQQAHQQGTQINNLTAFFNNQAHPIRPSQGADCVTFGSSATHSTVNITCNWQNSTNTNGNTNPPSNCSVNQQATLQLQADPQDPSKPTCIHARVLKWSENCTPGANTHCFDININNQSVFTKTPLKIEITVIHNMDANSCQNKALQ